EWMRRGKFYSFDELSCMAGQAKPFQSIVDVDDPRLRLAGDVPGMIQTLCVQSGEPVPETVGEIVRCINDSLALKFRFVKEQIDQCCMRWFSKIHIVAGGSQDKTICQAIADATGCTVYTGPVEASVYGNCSVQLIQAGLAKDLSQTREIIRNTIAIEQYEPMSNVALEDAYCRHQRMFCSTVG
ncbi:MAG: FGGY-family carbohydrate kinase, partial [Clostridia bacterium]